MYIEELLDHYKNPRNHGELENPHIKIFDTNPLCGDEVEIHAEITDNKIKKIKFIGKGCAISKASTSMMTEDFQEKSIQEIMHIPDDMILKRLGVPISAMRIKCALLGFKTLQKGIIKFKAQEENNGTRIKN